MITVLNNFLCCAAFVTKKPLVVMAVPLSPGSMATKFIPQVYKMKSFLYSNAMENRNKATHTHYGGPDTLFSSTGGIIFKPSLFFLAPAPP